MFEKPSPNPLVQNELSFNDYHKDVKDIETYSEKLSGGASCKNGPDGNRTYLIVIELMSDETVM